MDFRCRKNPAHKFQLESPPDKKGTTWAWKGIVRCPYCGSDDLEDTMIPAVMAKGVDLVKARRENRAATQMAMEMAGKARAEQDRRDPEVTLAPIAGASSYGRSAPVKVRKSLMDQIASKTPDNAFPGGE